jgi:RNA polymerase primary sigma factor
MSKPAIKKSTALKSGHSAARRSPTSRLTRVPENSNRRTNVRVANQPTVSASADHLSVYFRELGAHGLLEPEQERELARQLELAEVETWSRLLSHPGTADYLLNIMEARLDNSLSDFRKLRRSAAGARKVRVAANRAKLRTAAEKVGKQLRALDHDRQHVAAMVGELERLRKLAASGHSRFGTTRLAFSPSSRSFSKYLDGAVVSHERAQRLRDAFVRANLRLVVTMARRYDRGALPLSDLIQEGNLGLMHAVSRFDHKRGLRFSTYACWWIRHAIGRALADKSRAVRVPVHMIEAQQQLAKVRAKLINELGREPSRSEIADGANLPLSKLNQMNRFLLGSPISLDGPAGVIEEGRTLGEVLADPRSEEWAPEDDITTAALSSRVGHLMRRLTPIEADILKQRFGLEDDEERTFREIGDQYSLSRERIRQIQNAALGKLRRALDRDI